MPIKKLGSDREWFVRTTIDGVKNELVIRPAQAKDSAQLTVFLNPSLARGAAMPSLPPQAVARLLDEQAGLHLLALADETILGRARLRRKDDRAPMAELGIAVHPFYQRKGIASALLKTLIEAAGAQLGVKRIELKVFRQNLAAIKLYEKFGFLPMDKPLDLAFQEEIMMMKRL